MAWIGTALDRLIGEFSPSAGMRRSRARAMMALAMNYDGASKGRRTYGWKAPGSDADQAAYGARSTLRQLSRDFIRNRPYAARAQAVVSANVVGTGIVPAVQHEDPVVQERLSRLILGHLLSVSLDSREELDLYAMQDVAMKAVFSDGEVLARRRMRRGRFARGLSLGFQVELIECDQLDTTLRSWGANEVIEGIEYSPIGAVEAYHLRRVHPGSAFSVARPTETERVSWTEIVHVRRFDRPGQVRGVPWLAPVMMQLGELSDYQESQILKQKMSAFLVAVATYEKDAAMPGDNGLAGLEEMQPGMVVSAPQGAKIAFSEPPTVAEYPAFMREGLGATAMGVGITRESLTGDLSGTNFSSGRMGRMEMDRNVENWQRGLMVSQFCGGIERWLREAVPLVSEFRGVEFGMTWTPPRRPLIDPNDEIDAMLKQVEGGLASMQHVQRQLGLDPERVQRERAEDVARGADAPAAPASGEGAAAAPKAAARRQTAQELRAARAARAKRNEG